MRVWIDPERAAAHDLTAGDIVFGLFLTPVFYVVLMGFGSRRSRLDHRTSAGSRAASPAATGLVGLIAAAARLNASEFPPSLDRDVALKRERFSSTQVPSFGITHATTLRAPLDLSYEIDLWGRVRRSVQSSRALAEASAADLHHVRLGIQAEVARHYFNVRAVDRQIGIVQLIRALGGGWQSTIPPR